MDDEEQELRDWLHSFPPRWPAIPASTAGAEREAYRKVLFQEVIYELERLKDLFGYEAVYFGIGCEVFPDAIPTEE